MKKYCHNCGAENEEIDKFLSVIEQVIAKIQTNRMQDNVKA